MVIINGTAVDADDMTVEKYLSQTDQNRKRIAVEINGEIVPKSQYDTVSFKSGDIVEIVGFVGGG